MPDIFKPYSLSIKQVFDADNYYQIPSYQRPYSWDNEQIDELWDDILSALDDGKEEYFLGSIIVAESEDSKYLEVIDGQQRLTTLMILFCVLRDLHYKEHKDKNTILGRIRSLEDSENRLKLRTQPHHQNRFEQEVLNGIDFVKKRKISEIHADKFINAAFRFKDKIEALNDLTKLDALKEYILNNVKIILVKCSKPNFAMKLFEVLNTRGLDLTAADIIKSSLMAKLKKSEDWDTFEQEWISIEDKIKQFSDEESLNDLFTYYEYYLLAKNPKKTLQEELIKEFSNENSLKVISDFKKFLDFYFSIYSKSSKVFYSLRYLKHDVYWKSIILSAKMKNWEDKDIEKLGKILRKFYYLYWLADYTTSKTKQTSFNIIELVKSGKDVKFIEEEIDEKLLEDKIVTRLLDGLKGNVYDTAWCKPLLITIEYEQLDNPKQDFMRIDKDVQVEHILPRAYTKDEYWLKNFTEETAELLVNSLGNLTLLSGKKNIAASCNSFSSKIKNNYKGQGEDGNTSFIITQNLINESAREEKPTWDEDKVNKRRDWILKEIERIFNIKFEKANENEESFSKFGKLLQGKSEWNDKGKLIWQKKLAASDVERSQIGNSTGRLKLVKAGFKVNGELIDQTKYFRETIFGGLDWVEKEHTEKEITESLFVIRILGENYGLHRFTLGHNSYGEANQNNYTTHISWGEFGEIIKKLNLIDKELLLYASPESQKEPFYIEIK